MSTLTHGLVLMRVVLLQVMEAIAFCQSIAAIAAFTGQVQRRIGGICHGRTTRSEVWPFSKQPDFVNDILDPPCMFIQASRERHDRHFAKVAVKRIHLF